MSDSGPVHFADLMRSIMASKGSGPRFEGSFRYQKPTTERHTSIRSSPYLDLNTALKIVMNLRRNHAFRHRQRATTQQYVSLGGPFALLIKQCGQNGLRLLNTNSIRPTFINQSLGASPDRKAPFAHQQATN